MRAERETKPLFVVFDMDGTLCNIDHRLHHLERKDWRSFFAACPDDEPIPHMIESLVGAIQTGHRVAIWSGRSDEVRAETEAWLAKHGVPEVELVMRVAGDYRPDDAVKMEWLTWHGRPDLIIDDRKRVVDMWRAEGILCIQIAPGDF